VGLGQYTVQHFDNKKPFRLAIPFVNSGKTPAISTEEATAYSITDHLLLGPPAGYDYKFGKASAIAPQGAYVENIINSAVPPVYDSITNGTLFLYFWGEFRYHDIYDPNTVHTTDFCLLYDKRQNTMAFCYNGNTMN
jgi:hypothetical protein